MRIEKQAGNRENINISIEYKHLYWYGRSLNIPHLALLNQKPDKHSKILTYNLQIAITVEICFNVISNYAYLGLTYKRKGGEDSVMSMSMYYGVHGTTLLIRKL